MSEQVHVAEHPADVHPPAAAPGVIPTVAIPPAAIPPAAAPAAIPAAPFTERQLEQFDTDDGDAGRAIGKMLATFFLYTVVVMLIVAWWTFTR